MNTQLKIIALSIFLLAISCTRDNSPIEPVLNSNTDFSLIDEWIKFDTLDYAGSKPEIYITGFKVLDDSSIVHLAIETITGKVSMYQKSWSPQLKIVKAKDGKLIFETSSFFYPDGFSYDPGSIYVADYHIDGYILMISSDSTGIPISGKFYRTEMHDVVTEPIQTKMFCIIEKDTFLNADVWPYPSAYCTKFTPDSITNIRISAYNSENHEIEFYFKAHGIGKYILGNSQDGWARYDRKTGYGLQTKDENNGIIEITKFDLESKRCEGNFEFYIGELNFTSGSFSVPIYYWNF